MMRAAPLLSKVVARLGAQMHWSRTELLSLTERELVQTLRTIHE